MKNAHNKVKPHSYTHVFDLHTCIATCLICTSIPLGVNNIPVAAYLLGLDLE